MKNKIFKILIMLLIAIFIISIFSQTSFAYQIGNMFENKLDNSEASNHLSKILGTIINVLQIVASGIAVLMLIFIAWKYLYESPKGKAQIAKTTRYYVLGCIIIFSAVGLLQLVKKFAINNVKNW